ncbi:MAG: bifunctional riboflavin kinase/FAD synthetase [Woeseiaceae bacterium]|nr:bifunctional riboflavin kinase/FAD synthetase [Woeseiaceae bacterium]|tara:strand:- start:978 stop:1913 length:936 start_codon:yes stop_codon:yes gene_type:complete
MQLIRSINNFPYGLVKNGCILTIGAFDGLHLGHQCLLENVIKKSLESGLPSVVMSFEPTPGEFFSQDKPPARLMRFREKYQALKKLGIDIFFCPRFDEKVQNLEADDFIRQLLIQKLNLKYLVIGDDFHFARNRSGNYKQLKKVKELLEFEIKKISSIIVNDKRTSSTLIRGLLDRGKLTEASHFLGKPYQMSGRVIVGNQLGRELGYPTANINIQRLQSALMGIFAVKVHGISSNPLDAVASLGIRPTFYEGKKPLLEVHIFNFNKDIYGRYIDIDFISKIRDEIKFNSADALIEQMHKDAIDAKKILSA